LERRVGLIRKVADAVLQAALRFPDLVTVAVFGSVARGEERPGSDVDLLLVFDAPEDVVEDRVRDFRRSLPPAIDGHPLSFVAVSLDRITLDPQLLDNLLRDSVILYGRALVLSEQGLRLYPYRIIVYSTAHLPSTMRVRISRLLHGTPKHPGLLQLYNAVPLGRGVLLVPETTALQLKQILKQKGVRIVQELPIWTRRRP